MSNAKGTLIVDLDGTICPVKNSGENYSDLTPYHDVVGRLKDWRNEGFRIVIHTARNMRTYEGNLGLINVHTSRMTMDWLDKWEIPYDEILFGKPWPGHEGYYVDDRAIRPDEFLKYSSDELKILLEKSKEIFKKVEE
ncbi:capsular biosynthesis protein [Paenibacillus sp. QZ-Y1]|uniref:capsular biosynthesis protein n=1 Tax=Paenibacillus sp. QZ-Y1 TaxID=3414511 RepID=UPI003F79375F